MKDTDEIHNQLIDAINRKEKDAFREIFRMFYRYLVLYAIRFTQDKNASEDIVQDVFANLWKSQKNYNSFYGFRIFLFESVKNGCINYLKHKQLENKHIDYTLSLEQINIPDNEDYELMREDIYRRLYIAVEKLPNACRKIFEQHLAGKKNEEIAQLFSLSIETVKAQKKKAFRILREQLGESYLLVLIVYISH